jgi:hypothetical protein
MIATTNLMNAEVKNPSKLPNAALRAVLESALFINSPAKAPTKAPIIKPPGIGVRSPMMSPTEVPIIPALVPPNFLVPRAGII